MDDKGSHLVGKAAHARRWVGLRAGVAPLIVGRRIVGHQVHSRAAAAMARRAGEWGATVNCRSLSGHSGASLPRLSAPSPPRHPAGTCGARPRGRAAGRVAAACAQRGLWRALRLARPGPRRQQTGERLGRVGAGGGAGMRAFRVCRDWRPRRSSPHSPCPGSPRTLCRRQTVPHHSTARRPPPRAPPTWAICASPTFARSPPRPASPRPA